MPSRPDNSTPPLHYRKRHRLSHDREFQLVYAGRVRKQRGPLIVFALPNGRSHPRLGLSVGRRVGSAVKRHAIKRRLREAFRHLQHDCDRGYDLVVNVRPHEVMIAGQYQDLLSAAWEALDRQWTKREPTGGGTDRGTLP